MLNQSGWRDKPVEIRDRIFPVFGERRYLPAASSVMDEPAMSSMAASAGLMASALKRPTTKRKDHGVQRHVGVLRNPVSSGLRG